GKVCSAGTCATSCISGTSLCTYGKCHDLQSDNANCGTCGTTCPAGKVCSAGTCATSCISGTSLCTDGKCHDLQTDNANCGTCGTVCAAGKVCSGGTCSTTCGAGLSLCSGACTNTRHDPTNCSATGACGTSCPSGASSTAVCASGTCSLLCTGGKNNCDGNATNGCESDPKSDVNNCGFCGNKCGGTTPYCSSGVCVATPPTCKIVGGVPWCTDPTNTCGNGCAEVCAANGMPFTIDNATWFAAQDTATECEALRVALGYSTYSIASYTYGCLEVEPTGRLICSSYSGCPQNHRTMADGTKGTCDSTRWKSVCPCQ
ncbi:MAG: hypothetical protein HYV09_30190, partial [Deltaproteobacteria bacterium]|nr:hypothetical protein [Deltaproteobacteria bacterium]